MRKLIKIIIPILIFTLYGGKKQTDTFKPISKIGYDKTVKIDSIFSKYPKTSFKTGDYFFYSNSAYVLLANIIEQVSNQTYTDFVQENIFNPLGMSKSKVITSRNDYSNVAIGFENRGNYRPVECGMVTTGANGIITTLNDMVKWTNNYYDNQLGSKDQNLVNRMQTKGVLNNGESLSYGLGLFVENQCKQKLVWHGEKFRNLELIRNN